MQKGRRQKKQLKQLAHDLLFREESYEWFKGYEELKPILSFYIKKEHKILIVGSGNSELSAKLYDDYNGLEVVNIDYSEVVIEKMIAKNQQLRPLMTCICSHRCLLI
jgi:SAM-dependent methyltransferase